MNTLWFIIKFQVHDNIRNKWLIGYFLFFIVLSYSLSSFTNDGSKIVLSLLNVNLIVIPLATLIFGTIFLYNNRDYIILILSQPIDRKILYLGLYLGLSVPMSLSYLLGCGIPTLLFLKKFEEIEIALIQLFVSGIIETFLFIALSFLIVILNDNKMKGLGISIFIWLFFSALYDGLILIILHVFNDYPLEIPILVFSLLNPVDLSRLLVVLNFDISALMGYTGAIYNKFFNNNLGMIISFISMIFWFVVPLLIGIRKFSNKDF